MKQEESLGDVAPLFVHQGRGAGGMLSPCIISENQKTIFFDNDCYKLKNIPLADSAYYFSSGFQRARRLFKYYDTNMDAKIKEVGVRGGDSPPLHVEKKPLNSRAEKKKKLDSNLSDLYKYTPTILLHLGFVLFSRGSFFELMMIGGMKMHKKRFITLFQKEIYLCFLKWLVIIQSSKSSITHLDYLKHHESLQFSYLFIAIFLHF